MSRLMLTFGLLVVVAVVIVAELVRRRRLKERHAAIWLVFGVAVIVAAVLPGTVIGISEFLGFEVPANLVLVAGLVVLAFVALQLSVEIGRLRDLVERLATEIALLAIDDGSGREGAGDNADRIDPAAESVQGDH